MKKTMEAVNYDNLWDFAFSNDKEIKGEVKGIVMELNHLYFQEMLIGAQNTMAVYTRSERCAEYINRSYKYAEEGIIFVLPYTNPWSWMNDVTVDFCDRILDVLIEKYNLKDPKIVVQGMSMGGGNTLAYCHLTKHKLCGALSNCGVCDLWYHYSERQDLPRTILSPFGHYDCTLEEAVKTVSPIHNVDRMQRIPYLFFANGGDSAVHKNAHADKMVPLMREKGFDVEYIENSNRGHVDLRPEQWDRYFSWGMECILK